MIQLYYGAPQGLLGKPARVLAAFEKTRELKPGEEQALILSFKTADMASMMTLEKYRNLPTFWKREPIISTWAIQ